MYLCVDLYWATLDSHILPAGLQGHGLGDMLHDFVSLQGWAQAWKPRASFQFHNNSSGFFTHLSEHFRRDKIFLKKMNYLSILCKKNECGIL